MFVVKYGTHGRRGDTWAMFAAEDLLRPSVLASRPKERQRDVRNQVGGCYPRLGQGELVELMEVEREREEGKLYTYIYIYCHRAIGIRMERILKERGTTLYVSHLCALSPKFTPSRLLQMCHHGCSTCQCPNISYPSAIKHGHG